MASILDLLKAKGIDPNQLSSQVSQKPDDLADLQALSQSKSPDQSPQLPPDQPSSAPVSTDNVPVPSNIDPNVAFQGFPEEYDTKNEPESNDNESDSDDEDSSPISSKSTNSFSMLSKSPTSQKEALDNLLGKQQGFTDNTVAGLKAAQDEAEHNRHIANLGRIGAELGRSIAGIGTHSGLANNGFDKENPMAEYYKDQYKNAGQGVTDFTARGEQEKNDPNSAISAQARSFAGPLLAKLGMKMPENVSYTALEKLNPNLTKMSDAQDLAKARHEDLALKYSLLNQSKQDKATAKSSSDQDKALLSTNQLLESARGNPAAAQAEKDIYSADKAKSLANLYGDPNKLNPAMVQLLSSEVAKIAAGGAPTMHELEGLTPQTLQTKLATQVEKLTNSPSPANAAAFVKQYQDYADALTGDAKKVIQDKYGRVIESRKKQLGDTNYDTLKQQYINRFGTTPTGTMAKSSSTSAMSSEDQQAIDWAKANPSDPRADQILKLHGVQ